MNKKSAIISIIGRPNAGKSTLLNQIIGQKIAIVTHKVQTTRTIINGIHTINNTQLIFTDTPGIFNPQKKLEKAMVRCAWSSIAGADIIVILIDITNKRTWDEEFIKILKHLSNIRAEKIIVFNKMDKISNLQEIESSAKKTLKINEIKDILNIESDKINILENLFPEIDYLLISAEKAINKELLLEYLSDKAKYSEWLYDGEEITTISTRFLAEEITREQLFLKLSDELPYELTVDTDKWEQVTENEAKIYQSVIVKREAHKKIILGHKGKMIKTISENSRKELEKTINSKIHLFLFVKVRENWDKNLASN